MTVSEQKKQLRAQVRKVERNLPDEYRLFSNAKILHYVKQLPEYHWANCIFCFVGTSHEIDTFSLLQDILMKGKRLCVPLCVADGIMELREISSLIQLNSGAYGILEPAIDSKKVELSEVDLSIIPCVSCDHEGHRLGQGGGYYDRLFSHGTDNTVMLCRERLVRSPIPTEPFDQSFLNVITDAGFFRAGEMISLTYNT